MSRKSRKGPKSPAIVKNPDPIIMNGVDQAAALAGLEDLEKDLKKDESEDGCEESEQLKHCGIPIVISEVDENGDPAGFCTGCHRLLLEKELVK